MGRGFEPHPFHHKRNHAGAWFFFLEWSHGIVRRARFFLDSKPGTHLERAIGLVRLHGISANARFDETRRDGEQTTTHGHRRAGCLLFWSGFIVRGRACSIPPLLSKPLMHAIPGRDPWELPNECVDGRYETIGALEGTGRSMGREHHVRWRTPPIILWGFGISVVP